MNTRCAAFHGADGRLFTTYERPGGAPCRMPPPQAEGTRMDGDELLVFRDVEHDGQRVGSLALRQAMNRMDRVVSSTGIVAAVLAGALLLGLLVSARMRRLITRPMLTVVAVARGVTERRDHSLRVQKSGRDEVGLLTQANRELDLGGMAHKVAREILAAQPGWSARFDIAPGLQAQGDPARVRTVPDNLLGNAAKFSAGRPDARVMFGAQQQDGQTVIVVQDNGVGFDIAHAARLFGAFQRLHPPGEFEGTGIGLANVQRIIQRHGGRDWAEGRPGQGVSFYFTLPG